MTLDKTNSIIIAAIYKFDHGFTAYGRIERPTAILSNQFVTYRGNGEKKAEIDLQYIYVMNLDFVRGMISF